MNREIIKLREEIINLDEQIKNLSRFIRITEEFIEKKGKYYTSEESIKAINAIKTILIEKKEELDALDNNTEKKRRKFWNSCQHEILVKDDLNNFCAICGRLIIEIPNTSLLQVTVPNNCYPNQINIQNTIQKIIGKGIKSDNMLDYVEEELEELQFKEDISIRGLIK